MTEQSVLYEVRDHVAYITLNRPERRNALHAEALDGLLGCYQKAAEDSDVRVLVLTGAGEKVFSSGADLAAGLASGQGMLDRHYGNAKYVEAITAPRKLGKPLIARINGHVLAGGMGLMLSADFAIAPESATFSTPEIKVGLFPYMVMALLFRTVGRRKGLEMVLTGEKVTAADAVTMGLINSAVPADELDTRVDELAQKLAEKSPAVLKLGLGAYHALEEMGFDEALTYLQGCLTINLMTEDAMEGIAAFLSKRKPEFKGK